MKRCILAALSALLLAASSTSCQRFFSSSPLASVLSDPDYHLPDPMTLDQALEVSRQAIDAGNADLAGRMLGNLAARTDIPENRSPEVLKVAVSLALLVTRISGAVIESIKAMPADGSDPSPDQQATIEAAMARVDCKSDSIAYSLFSGMSVALALDPANASYASVSGSDIFFAGLTLVQTVARGRTGLVFASLSPDEIATVTLGANLVVAGTARLDAEGVPADVITSLSVFADVGS